VAQPLIDKVTPVWDGRLILGLLNFLEGHTDGDEAASRTKHLLVSGCKDGVFGYMPDEIEDLGCEYVGEKKGVS
jgi:hypothetical protein